MTNGENQRLGAYVETSAGGERVRAYVPAPLPPNPPLELGRFMQVYERAIAAVGRLDGVTTILPSTPLFLYMYVRKEALLSSQIEGTQSSLSDLLLFENHEVPAVELDDVTEVSNYVAAIEHGVSRMRGGFPLSLRLIREMHAILLKSGRGAAKQPGEFRRSQNWIGGTRPGNALFVPPPPNRLDECLDALERFLHSEDAALPPLIRAGLAHVQFETIHPFLDGNGRLGRLLITLILCEAVVGHIDDRVRVGVDGDRGHEPRNPLRSIVSDDARAPSAFSTARVAVLSRAVIRPGEAIGDVSERDIRRIQIRETIKAHLDKEKQLFTQGIKVLSLFFIDEVVKYRDYAQPDEKGEYARVFEEEYGLLKQEYLSELAIDNEKYRTFLQRDAAAKVHEGYFSIDKQKRLVDPEIKKTGEDKGQSDDADAYDLILRNKERLLSQTEPVRFIFSHSALREGWDNPNVFVMCMLKHSDNTISRRQEVGRGLRLSVDQNGDRMDNPAVVHDINVLTVVASESYTAFVSGLQKEIADTLTSRPWKATEAYFTGKTIASDAGPIEITPAMAKQIYRYLVKNDYSDESDQITTAYHEAKAAGTLAALPDDLKPHADQIFQIIDSVFSNAQLPKVDDGRKPKTNPLNDNFEKKEFQELWRRINQKAVYRVEFVSDELIRKCVSALDSQLRVTPLQYTVQTGVQGDGLTDEQLKAGDGFSLTGSTTERGGSIHSLVKYDLLGKVAENTELTRKTVADVLAGIQASVFGQFRENPEHFIAEASRIIAEQKATMIIERLAYDSLAERYDVDIFTANQTGQDFSKASAKLKHHVYDYIVTDSEIERKFAGALDASSEVVVYAKLPRGFLIPTPVGDYNPDWAISFKEGSVKHIYFVAETKGTMSSMKLREIENTKIACARKFFDEIGRRVSEDRVKYDVVTSYEKLMDIVGRVVA